MSGMIQILGDVNKKGNYEIPSHKTIKEILNEYAGGMKKSKKVKLVQIGGPLGTCIRGTELNNKLSDYENSMTGNMIIFSNELLCPVDYLRFLTRFMVRELRVDNEHIRKLNELVEKIAQGVASMADFDILSEEVRKDGETNAEDALNKIFIYITTEFRNEFMEHILNKKCKNGICRALFRSQCMNACPAEVYVPGYIELMKQDRIEDAYRLMRKNNPFSFICGKVCARPCENRCRRGEIEGTVGIRALKRYAADMAIDIYDFKEDKLESKNKKVAVVGAGPAGLAAAYFLARTGYEVVVYEANEVVGGMLAVGIPEYRLPQKTIDVEVQLIKDLGVEIITNMKIGENITLKELRKDFNAVILATGCHIGNVIPGTDVKGVETAIKLLKEVKVEGRKEIGKQVLVIGGGDVAMDAVRTAIRLGAETVKLASLEEYEGMPANDEEKEEAIEEGIEFINGYGAKEVHTKDGVVTGITLKKCTTIFDDEYNFNPQFNEADTKELNIDTLIFAIGQRADSSYLDEDIKLNKRGWIERNSETFETTAEGVYVAGDMYKPGSAISAIADAQKVASSIDRYLGGNGIYLGKDIEVPETILKSNTWSDKLVKVKVQCADERKLNFNECANTYTKEEAKFEATRCMRCDRNSVKPLYFK